MERRRRFLNPAQPQTLQIAVFLFYATAAWTLFAMVVGQVFPLFYVVMCGVNIMAAFFIANESRYWGYYLGIAAALMPFVYFFFVTGNPFAGYVGGVFGLLNLMFQIALVVLLLHPQSRDYQRIWFK